MKRAPDRENLTERAKELALLALGFLAGDEERLMRFLALTGLDRGDVADLLGESGFHLAILDHLAGDEPLLIEFASENGVTPEAVGVARRALGGGEEG
jgi:hypothetical protein